MEIIFLGTNGWFDTQTGNTLCVLIKHPEYAIVLDAGNGFYKLDRYLTPGQPVFLFLSHFHLDHIIGLHTLNKFNFSKGLTIIGQEGTKSFLSNFIKKPFTISMDKLRFPLYIFDYPEYIDKLPFNVMSKPLKHSVPTVGYRFEVDDAIIAYCTDTGYCDNAVALAQDADFLMCECSFKSGQVLAEWPHLNPETAAGIAKEANAKKLALLHFDASLYTNLEDRLKAEKIAQSIFPESFAANDDTKYVLECHHLSRP